MAIIYLAAPYSHVDPRVREVRVAETSKIAATLMGQGHIVYSPITHGHVISGYMPQELVEDHAFWVRQGLPFLLRSDWMVIAPLPGWESSKGIEIEDGYAKANRIPVFVYHQFEEASSKFLLTIRN